MISLWSNPQEVSSFVSAGLWGGRRRIENCQAVGFGTVEDGLVAGVVFHNYDPDSEVIELTAYSRRRDWLTRDRLKEIFSYPFEQIGCRMCLARISENNTRTLRIWRALGADLYPIPDLRADGEAEVVAVLKRATWKTSKFNR